MKITGKNWIGGEWSSEGDSEFQAVDPETGDALNPRYYDASSKEIETACRRAKTSTAFFENLNAGQRADFLEEIAGKIEELGVDLIERAKRETALPEARLEGERSRTVNQLRMFAALVREGSWVEARVDTALPNRVPLPKPDIRRMLRPIGPVAVFGASNFPLAFSVAGGDTASAFAAGNPVIVKAHPAHPGTSELVASAIIEAIDEQGIDKGIFSILHGKGNQVGHQLVCHPDIRAVGFTGSLEGGRSLYDAACSRPEPIPVHAEMGSTNPVFILASTLESDARRVATELHQSVTLGVGQFCTNPGLVVIRKVPQLEDFEEQITDLTRNWKPSPMLHSGIYNSYQQSIQRLLDSPHIEVLALSNTKENRRNRPTAAIFKITAENYERDRAFSEEVFGPSTILVTCETEKEMVEVAESLRGQLTASIHTSDPEMTECLHLLKVLEEKAGRLIVNGFPTGVEVCSSMHHGGPYPATTDSRTTSVGTAAIQRFTRPVCYQDFPQSLLPEELKDENPGQIWRLIDNEWSKRGI